MKNRFFALRALALGSLVAFAGCSTDLDVTAPYQEITVVYSLLNKNDGIHWVKINKAYLGDGDAYAYAQIPDSTEYTEEQLPESERRIEKVDGSGAVVATLTLRDTILTERPEGIFAWPVHKMYYFRGDQPGGLLQQGFTYRLVCKPKGNVITSSTALVNDLIVPNPTGNPTNDMSFIFGNGYTPYDVKWQATANGRRYEAYYRFFYDEVYSDFTYSKSFEAPIGTVISSNNPGTTLETALSGELFYQTIGSRVPVPDESAVIRRIFRGIELYWWVAGADLSTYLQLANPISGIVEERPDYTNIEGGYGLMSSRIYRQVGGGDQTNRKGLNSQSFTELLQGQYTGGLKFCDPDDPDCN